MVGTINKKFLLSCLVLLWVTQIAYAEGYNASVSYRFSGFGAYEVRTVEMNDLKPADFNGTGWGGTVEPMITFRVFQIGLAYTYAQLNLSNPTITNGRQEKFKSKETILSLRLYIDSLFLGVGVREQKAILETNSGASGNTQFNGMGPQLELGYTYKPGVYFFATPRLYYSTMKIKRSIDNDENRLRETSYGLALDLGFSL
jgi:hypothetical protein